MKILVTGAAGFVGTHVINELLKYDHRVIAATTRPGLIDPTGKLNYAFLDLDNIDAGKNYCAHFDYPDVLIHLAWQGLPHYKSLFHFENNLMGHYVFLKNMVSHGLTKVVAIGTCLEYGMKEGCLSEEMTTDPQNPYALAKDTLRKFLFEFQKKQQFDCTWIRLFYMYGKGQNSNALLLQLETALQRGDAVFNMSAGEQLRDYLPVEKVSEYIVNISLQNMVSGIINCCSGNPIKIIDLVENYLNNAHKKIKLNRGFYPYPDYEPMSFWGDDTKLKKILSNERSDTGV
jgi:nucleoside-diphosphate-sugar epimerase